MDSDIQPVLLRVEISLPGEKVDKDNSATVTSRTSRSPRSLIYLLKSIKLNVELILPCLKTIREGFMLLEITDTVSSVSPG